MFLENVVFLQAETHLMKVNGNTAKALCAILIGAFLVTSCGEGEKASVGNSPSSVVTAFNKAILEKNYKEALTYTDTRQEDYELFEAWMKMMFDEMGGSSLYVLSEDLSEDGNVASVKVKLENGKSIDTLYTQTVKVEGEWRVRLVSDF